MEKKISIVIPCYNDSGTLPEVLASILKVTQNLQSYLFSFVVIEDGSNNINLENLASIPSCYLLRHSINLGQGAALQTGFEFCKRSLNPDFVVTMDADGQHSPHDLAKFIDAIENKSNTPDIVFGNRFNQQSNIPRTRKLILKAAVRFEKYITGLDLSDAHNGFRIFNRNVLNHIQITQNRMAHATQFKQIVARHKFIYSEVPVQVNYSEDSLSKGQKNSGSLIILRDLIKSYIFER